MDIKRVKYNLGRRVTHNGSEYIFTACLLKVGNEGFYHSAELTALEPVKSVTVCRLEEVDEICTTNTKR